MGKSGRKNPQKAAEVKKLSTAKHYELKLHIQRLLMIDIDRKANNQELWEEFVELKKVRSGNSRNYFKRSLNL